jgi:hypothetical protein
MSVCLLVFDTFCYNIMPIRKTSRLKLSLSFSLSLNERHMPQNTQSALTSYSNQ